jgi:hypothetical protein
MKLNVVKPKKKVVLAILVVILFFCGIYLFNQRNGKEGFDLTPGGHKFDFISGMPGQNTRSDNCSIYLSDINEQLDPNKLPPINTQYIRACPSSSSCVFGKEWLNNLSKGNWSAVTAWLQQIDSGVAPAMPFNSPYRPAAGSGTGAGLGPRIIALLEDWQIFLQALQNFVDAWNSYVQSFSEAGGNQYGSAMFQAYAKSLIPSQQNSFWTLIGYFSWVTAQSIVDLGNYYKMSPGTQTVGNWLSLQRIAFLDKATKGLPLINVSTILEDTPPNCSVNQLQILVSLYKIAVEYYTRLQCSFDIVEIAPALYPVDQMVFPYDVEYAFLRKWNYVPGPLGTNLHWLLADLRGRQCNYPFAQYA